MHNCYNIYINLRGSSNIQNIIMLFSSNRILNSYFNFFFPVGFTWFFFSFIHKNGGFRMEMQLVEFGFK